jgi:DNA primase
MTHKDIIAEHFEQREAVFSRRVRGYVGVCPFHTEKTGSCNYNVEKDTFYWTY